jgi:predicted ATPase/class 3 adenylate cyclase
MAAFLFSDISGSTELLRAVGAETYAAALAQHREIIRRACAQRNGTEVNTQGDSFFLAFPAVLDAIACALDTQVELRRHRWPDGVALSVRIAVHVGEALSSDEDYVGLEIHRAARIMAAGHGGQVLLSGAAEALARDHLPSGAGLLDLGQQVFKDLPEPEHVFQLTYPELAVAFPPLRTAVARGNLPAETSTFIGREAEIEEVDRLLADPAVRLVTLTGPGGTGKTRLALKVAEVRAPALVDGAFFVDLTPATDTDGALALIGQAFGLALQPGQSPLQRLKDELHGAEALLVLDNLEHVVSAAPAIADVLAACPRVDVLATSREPLHIRPEHVYPVRSLALPPTDVPAGAELGGFEAIRLFVERARAIDPGFRMTDDNASAIVEICRRVDGLPLAIELATARLRVFSPEALRDRLGSRLDLLRGGARDLPERQRTIRATIEWSYELLEPGDRLLFEILSVFTSATYDAIEAVVARMAPDVVDAVDVIDGVTSLIDKSLIRPATEGPERRVGMLETIREYAAERLLTRPDVAAEARRAHASYFSEVDVETLPGLRVEIENLRDAWRYWVGQGDLDRLDAMIDGLWHAHEELGAYQAAIGQADDVLALTVSMPPSPERRARQVGLEVRRVRAMLVANGYTKETEDRAAQALEEFEAEGAGQGDYYPVLKLLLGLYTFRTEFEKAGVVAAKIQRLAEEREDGQMAAEAKVKEAAGRTFLGDLVGAADLFDEAIAWYDAHPPTTGSDRAATYASVSAQNASALNLWMLGYPDRAVERAKQGVSLAGELANPYWLAYANYHSGLLHLWRREPELALRHAHGVLEAIRDRDIAIWQALGTCLVGAAKVGLDQAAEGLAQFDGALQLYRGVRTPPIFWPFLRVVQADAYGRGGRVAEALRIVDEVLAMPGYEQMPQNFLVKGVLLSATSDPANAAAAATALRSAYDGAAAIGARMIQLQAATAIRRAGIANGSDAGLVELGSTYDWFSEGFDTPELQAARELLQPPADIGRGARPSH